MRLKYVNNNDQHMYILDGKRCKSVTGISDYPDDKYALNQWYKRMVAIGLTLDPSLIEAVAAHYDDKNKVDGYCKDAIKFAKAHSGSTRGTAVHRYAERHILGEFMPQTPLAAYVVESFQAALEQTELEPIADLCERIIVYPNMLIAGRFDIILRHRETGRLYLGDFKGGERALQYPHAMACQVSLYGNAPLMAGPIPDSGGETTVFQPMPDVDKQWGYIFHLPDSGTATVARVRIDAGWETVQQIIFPTIAWRARRDLCEPISTEEPCTAETNTGKPSATPPQQETKTRSTTPSDPSSGKTSEKPGSVAPPGRPPTPPSDTTSPTDGGSQPTPTGTPGSNATSTTPKKSGPKSSSTPSSAATPPATTEAEPCTTETNTSQHSSTISATSTTATQPKSTTPSDPSSTTTTKNPTTCAPKTTGSPTPRRTATTVANLTAPPPIDEGPQANPDDVAALRKRYLALYPTARYWCDHIKQAANTAGYDIALGGPKPNPTMRRLHITEALITLASAGMGEDEVLDAVIFGVLGDNQPYAGLGATIGALDFVSAHSFLRATQRLAATSHNRGAA